MQTRILRSRRKTLSLRITPLGDLEIRAPLGMPERDIQAFVAEKARWIETHRARVLRDQAQGALAPLDEAALEGLKEQTRQKLAPMLERHGAHMGVSYGRVSIRCQQTRWGSCSAEGNLNFHCRLARAPEEGMG